MARNDNLTDLLMDIADSIREKEGSTGLINPQDFPERIAAISGGGSTGGDTEGKHRVLFIDADGTVLKEQFVADGEAADAPPDPSLEMCEFTGWSDDFTNVTSDEEIFAMYRSSDGNTRYRIDCPAGAAMTLLILNESAGCETTIDWGDGTADTITSRNNYETHMHVFAEAVDGWVTVYSNGKYKISVGEEGSCIYVLGVVVGDNVSTIDRKSVV